MKHIFPYPLLSLVIFTLWLVLAGTYSTASLTFSALLGIFVPQLLRILRPEPVRIKSLSAALKLTGLVLCDIIRSNIAVTSIIFGRKKHARSSGFVHIPLTMKSHHGLAVLSIIVTSTPGTLWVQYDSRKKILLLHVLDLVDKDEWIKLIQSRYERFLIEIFE